MSIFILSFSIKSVIGFVAIHRIYRTAISRNLMIFMCLYIFSCAKALTEEYVLLGARTFDQMSKGEFLFQFFLGALFFFYCYKFLKQLKVKSISRLKLFTMGAFLAGVSSYIISYGHLLSDFYTGLYNLFCSILISFYVIYAGAAMRHGILDKWEIPLQNLIRNIGFVLILYIPVVWLVALIQSLTGFVYLQMITVDLILITAFSVVSQKSISRYVKKQSINRNMIVSSDFLDKYNISQREKDVLQLLLKGLSNKDIGEQLFISISTTRTHISHLFEKTGVRSRMELLYKVISS